jgi:hypothetical protein
MEPLAVITETAEGSPSWPKLIQIHLRMTMSQECLLRLAIHSTGNYVASAMNYSKISVNSVLDKAEKDIFGENKNQFHS